MAHNLILYKLHPFTTPFPLPSKKAIISAINHLFMTATKTNWVNIKAGVQQYLEIMEMVKTSNVQTDKEFQRKFNGFYRIRQRSKEFYEALYSYLEQNKNGAVSFEQTLKYFFEKFGRIEPSFSSKIVATITPSLPIWDSVVVENLRSELGIKLPGYHLEKQERFRRTVEIYKNIIEWYAKFMKSEEGKDMIKAFDEKIGKCDITNIKKIDFILWQTR